MTHPISRDRVLHHSIEPLEARIAPAIVSGTLPLSSLDQSHGIKITGPNGSEVG